MEFYVALWIAKALRAGLRCLGRDGSNLPGKVALWICPEFLERVGRPGRIVTVTGTNGKTTCVNLIRDALEGGGVRVLSNLTGSNTDTGVASCLLAGVTWRNRPRFGTAVLEVDERASVKVYPYLTPDVTLIVNLRRDSVMRNAHPAYMAEVLSRYIPDSTTLILNADDVISSGVAPGNRRVYFGLTNVPAQEGDIGVPDGLLCPVCAQELLYREARRDHMGRARCPRCGYASPEPDVAADCGALDRGWVLIREREAGLWRCPAPEGVDPGDTAAVIALLRTLGMGPERVREAMARAKVPESRHREVRAGAVRVIAHLAKDKNAVACSHTFRRVVREEGRKELLLMMNCLYDERHWSENVCWLYDCDFELLRDPSVTRIVAAGPRCLDYRLRLLLAGVPEERIRWDRREFRAAERLAFAPGARVYVLYGTDSVRLAGRVVQWVRLLGRGASA